VSSDFRVISAMNVPVQRAIDTGALRGDLAHRIAGSVIALPALAHRLEDIPALVAHFMAIAGPGAGRDISPEAVRLLMAQRWPGNVRELRNVIERAMALAANGRLDVPDIERALQAGGAPAASQSRRDRRTIMAVLEEHRWDMTASAQALGVHRTTLWRRLRRLEEESPLPATRRNDGAQPATS